MLDFLAQELSREANTINSKSQNIGIIEGQPGHQGRGGEHPPARPEHRVGSQTDDPCRVTGPSGCGKSTLIRPGPGPTRRRRLFRLAHDPATAAVGGRRAGLSFCEPGERFLRMVKAGLRRVGGGPRPPLRDVPEGARARAETGDVILDIDVQGAAPGPGKVPGAVFIFILPPSFAALRRRLGRETSDGAASIRLEAGTARKEVRAYAGFDYLIINDDLDDGRAGASVDPASAAGRSCGRPDTRASAPILKSFRGEG